MKKGGKMSAHSPTGLFIIFYQYAYPSEPKIDSVGSAKKYKKNTKDIFSKQECDGMRKRAV